jgi:uncharacterized protein (DUF1684 family)
MFLVHETRRPGRRSRRRAAALLLGAAVAVSAAGSACGPSPRQPSAWTDATAREVQAWRSKHEADYRREWATIEGLHFLSPGSQTAGSARTNDVVLTAAVPPRIGRFTLADHRVTFEPEQGVPITINGQAATGPAVLRADGQTPTDEIAINGVTIVLHESGPRQSLRVRDPHGPHAKAFLGFTWFPLQPQYRVTGRFIPDAAARDVRVVNTFGDVDTYKTEGVIEFTLQGRPLRLRPFTTRPARFYIVFKDASSGAETYEAARFLYADLRDDGTTVLDFNEAYNPPCSFNPFTTCPIPLPENRLPVKVLAGEKKYSGQL